MDLFPGDKPTRTCKWCMRAVALPIPDCRSSCQVLASRTFLLGQFHRNHVSILDSL